MTENSESTSLELNSVRRVYYYTSGMHVLDNIRSRRLKLSRFSDVNDPFELEAISFANREMRDRFRLMRRELFDCRFGFLSFSRSWQNSIMWSHYAEKHTGVCLAFDVPAENLFDIRYANSRLYPNITVDTFFDQIGPDQIVEIVGTKHTHWSYEEEVRLLWPFEHSVEENGLFFASFSDGLTLKEVFLGPKTDCGIADVKKALGDTIAKVTPTRLSFEEFKIVKQLNKRFWKK